MIFARGIEDLIACLLAWLRTGPCVRVCWYFALWLCVRDCVCVFVCVSVCVTLCWLCVWLKMLKFLLNTYTSVFCQYCPRREGLQRGGVLRIICGATWLSPTTTLDRKRTTKRRRHVWWVEGLVFVCFRSVHGWVGMNVWMNVCFYDPILVHRLWTVENDV